MRAYWYDNAPGDQRLPHDSHRPVSPTQLSQLGILHHHIPVSDSTAVDAIASERHYSNRDEIEISPSTLPNYEEKVRNFFHEHLHEDEEIRYILKGGGYFDVRSEGDDWVRIALEEGDLMIMPAGIYHRFTTDENDYTKAVRLFKDEPKWTPLQRGEETDANEFRKQYLQTRDGHKAVAA